MLLILLLPFLAVAMLFLITPGPDMALVTRNALRQGRKAALLTSLGIMTGVLVWIGALAVGVAAILEANTFAFTILRLAGAAYLVYMGVLALVSLRKHTRRQLQAPEHHIMAVPVNSPYAQGLVNNLLNPKIAVFFTSLIPQFVTPGPTTTLESVELAGIFAVMGICWLTAYSILASRTGSMLRSPSIRKALDAVTGTVLVALGAKVAIETR